MTTTKKRRAADKRRLSELLVSRVRVRAEPFVVWDTKVAGLGLRVRPSGARSWYYVYARHNRSRWLRFGDANAIPLSDARQLATEAALAVANGKDPAAERRAERDRGTFAELAMRYVEEDAKKNNKSWRQADALVRKHLIPRWGALQAAAITRSDVKAMKARIEAPVVANQVLAAGSAIFSWAAKEEYPGITVNPFRGIDRNKTVSRERVLSDNEIPRFWSAFDDAGLITGTALKLILLSGQRPGEVIHMRREHIIDGWWTMPGAPVPALGWSGTKNGEGHRVWLPQPAQALLAELSDDDEITGTGFVFTGERGGPISKLDPAMRAICEKLRIEPKVTPHDLRRTFGTTVTGLGFGREAMDRIMNHKEASVGDIYDRHDYSQTMKHVMEAVAAHIMALATGEPLDNVTPIRRGS